MGVAVIELVERDTWLRRVLVALEAFPCGATAREVADHLGVATQSGRAVVSHALNKAHRRGCCGKARPVRTHNRNALVGHLAVYTARNSLPSAAVNMRASRSG